MSTCELCQHTGGILLWKNELCRVILLENTPFKGFCRVVLNKHVKEMTDLPESEQHALMRIVFKVEHVLRELFRPEKINLASLGNKTPHIHWHVTPRFVEDMTFPDSIWSAPHRPQPNASLSDDELSQLRTALDAHLS